MIDPRVVLVLALAAGLIYGGKVAVKAVGHGVKKAVVVLTHPLRHPVKDGKAVGHAVSHPKLFEKN